MSLDSLVRYQIPNFQIAYLLCIEILLEMWVFLILWLYWHTLFSLYSYFISWEFKSENYFFFWLEAQIIWS